MSLENAKKFYEKVKSNPERYEEIKAFATSDPSKIEDILSKAKEMGYEISKEDYFAFLENASDLELDESMLASVVGGKNDNQEGSASGEYFEVGGGNNTVHAGDGGDTIISGDGTNKLYGEGGDDYIKSGDGNDTLDGGSGNDTIKAGGGNDNISGGEGNDYILAHSGNDTVHGGKGSDIIYGGSGNDRLSGGSGSDTFSFSSGDGNDTITDFDASQDKLEINGVSSDDIQISYVNGNTILTFGDESNGSITLENTELTSEDLEKVLT